MTNVIRLLISCFFPYSFMGISLSSNLKEKTSVMDLIKGKSLMKADGSSQSAESALAGKDIIMFYFSAHWCPPCRGFTPMLKDFYEVI